jgi:hypothetical protein
VDALAILVIGWGGFMIYEAFKKSSPTPVTTAKAAVTGAAN